MGESLLSLRPVFRRWRRFIIHSLELNSKSEAGNHYVLLHGLGACAHSYASLMHVLCKTNCLITAPDMPAHGLSPCIKTPLCVLEAYCAVASVLRERISVDKSVILVGNSLGGAFAVNFALDFPELVKGLFLISPAGAPFTDPISSTLDRFKPTKLSQARQVIDLANGKRSIASSPLAPFVLTMLKQRAMQSLIDSIDNDSCFTPQDLQRLNVPTYLLWGKSDKILPSYQRDYYTSHLPPGFTLDTPEGYSHCPQFSKAEEVGEKIIDFASGLR